MPIPFGLNRRGIVILKDFAKLEGKIRRKPFSINLKALRQQILFMNFVMLWVFFSELLHFFKRILGIVILKVVSSFYSVKFFNQSNDNHLIVGFVRSSSTNYYSASSSSAEPTYPL